MVTILGPGRVGQVFARCAQQSGREFQLVGKDTPLPAPSGPILVCVRNEHLEDLSENPEFSKFPVAQRLFVQNGILPLDMGTLGILYFAATDTSGEAKAGGESLFYGPLASYAVRLLQAGGLPAREIGQANQFKTEQAIKLGWLVVFGLVGERYQEPVKDSVKRDEIGVLARELAPVFQAALQLDALAPATLLARWTAYSEQIPTWNARVKDRHWRDCWVARQAKENDLSTPVFSELRKF